MSEPTLYPVKPDIAARTWIDDETYRTMYEASVADPDAFWREHGQRLEWIKPYTKVKNTEFGKDAVTIKWFEDGVLNASANCIDRHLESRGDQVAIIWESDDPAVDTKITYRELFRHVCRFANALKAQGIKKGDVVTIYMPMIPEAAYAMLACARIGAIHSVIFGGFSADAIANRIAACNSNAVITADEGVRGGRTIPLKANIDEALTRSGTECVETVVMVRYTGAEVGWVETRDVIYQDIIAQVPDDCEPEPMNAEDPLFILYTSGSTGVPKGVMHTTGGYMVYASMTHQYAFDYHNGDIYWCTADVGWITGHSYILYGPLANGATTLMFEGVPTYPGINRMSQVVDKHQINILYTAPTAIRGLMADGDAAVQNTTRESLKILGSVGEPINPAAWQWYYETMGNSSCPIIDTWWQTETGGFMLTPLPGATPLKPGSATRPFFGVKPALVDGDGQVLEGEAEGILVIEDSWPGQARSVYGDHPRFIKTYFTAYPGYFFTGDGASRDADGYYWITGRVDDVLSVSGHRLGTAEIESAVVLHDKVAEAAVVGYPHHLKGEGIYVYVTLNHGVEGSDELADELCQWVRKEIGPIAQPDLIQWAPGLPKTRSGKIMRRILRKIAENDYGQLGDTSTLADPSVVDDLIANRKNR
ncbi:Acetyl-coenzyme A synthetase [gamma proteobacterium IMCC2047]|nr:Acetyl-coenzyme A synthetase [gamma proteobacterium IMCC2047]